MFSLFVVDCFGTVNPHLQGTLGFMAICCLLAQAFNNLIVFDPALQLSTSCDYTMILKNMLNEGTIQ
jgi:hypothetical protein